MKKNKEVKIEVIYKFSGSPEEYVFPHGERIDLRTMTLYKLDGTEAQQAFAIHSVKDSSYQDIGLIGVVDLSSEGVSRAFVNQGWHVLNRTRGAMTQANVVVTQGLVPTDDWQQYEFNVVFYPRFRGINPDMMMSWDRIFSMNESSAQRTIRYAGPRIETQSEKMSFQYHGSWELSMGPGELIQFKDYVKDEYETVFGAAGGFQRFVTRSLDGSGNAFVAESNQTGLFYYLGGYKDNLKHGSGIELCYEPASVPPCHMTKGTWVNDKLVGAAEVLLPNIKVYGFYNDEIGYTFEKGHFDDGTRSMLLTNNGVTYKMLCFPTGAIKCSIDEQDYKLHGFLSELYQKKEFDFMSSFAELSSFVVLKEICRSLVSKGEHWAPIALFSAKDIPIEHPILPHLDEVDEQQLIALLQSCQKALPPLPKSWLSKQINRILNVLSPRLSEKDIEGFKDVFSVEYRPVNSSKQRPQAIQAYKNKVKAGYLPSIIQRIDLIGSFFQSDNPLYTSIMTQLNTLKAAVGKIAEDICQKEAAAELERRAKAQQTELEARAMVLYEEQVADRRLLREEERLMRSEIQGRAMLEKEASVDRRKLYTTQLLNLERLSSMEIDQREKASRSNLYRFFADQKPAYQPPQRERLDHWLAKLPASLIEGLSVKEKDQSVLLQFYQVTVLEVLKKTFNAQLYPEELASINQAETVKGSRYVKRLSPEQKAMIQQEAELYAYALNFHLMGRCIDRQGVCEYLSTQPLLVEIMETTSSAQHPKKLFDDKKLLIIRAYKLLMFICYQMHLPEIFEEQRDVAELSKTLEKFKRKLSAAHENGAKWLDAMIVLAREGLLTYLKGDMASVHDKAPIPGRDCGM